MAPRDSVQEGNRVGVVKRRKKMVERGALGEISNLIIPLPPPAINRPVTRSFRAQLAAVADAQSQNQKKPMAVNIATFSDMAQNSTVIEISPDTEVLKKSKSWSLQNKTPQSSLTSTLTARSKAARCPKQTNVVDIDAQDVDNELAEIEYVEDIYKFYKLVEKDSMVHDYMHMQPKMTDKERASLIDWLIGVHDAFDLTNETLYLAINILDRFLSTETVTKTDLRCVGVTAMLIASKYVETWGSTEYDFVEISDNRYDKRDVLMMEKRILSRLEWSLTVPTPYVFLARFIKAAAATSPLEIKVEQMVYFYAELGMMNYNIIIRYCPSMVAASAVYTARNALNKNPVWHDTLEMHTGYTETQMMGCVKMLVMSHLMVKDDEKRKAIYEKYSSKARGKVTLHLPPKSLLS